MTLKSVKKFMKRFLGERPTLYIRYLYDKKKMIKLLEKEKNNEQEQKQKATEVAILFIGTNKYVDYFQKYYETIKEYFLPNTKKTFFVFTNIINYPYLGGKKDIVIVSIKHENWPFVTLKRFEYFNKITKKLKKYSHIIYIDSDMYADSVISEKKFFSHDKPLFGVRHPTYITKTGQFEKNPESMAFVGDNEDISIYRQGCFWGGKSKEILKLSKELEKRVNKDLKKNIIALWHDESHLNRYFIERKEGVYTYSPAYAYPEKMPIPKRFKKRFIHADKNQWRMHI